MSSHREAPEISKDPVADNTDLYAFVSPDRPDTVTLIANFIPLQGPAGGPNFYEFGDDVLYSINIDNNGDGKADVTYQFRFTTQVRNPDTFLYNTGPIQSLTDPNWNRRQFYTLHRGRPSSGSHRCSARGLACPPCNIGPLSTPNYPALAAGRRAHDAGRHARSSPASGPRASTSTSVRCSICSTCGRWPEPARTFGLTDLPPRPSRRQRTQVPQRAQHRAAGAEDRPHRLAARPDRCRPRPPVGHRRLVDGQPAQGQHPHSGDGTSNVRAGPYVQVSRLGNPLFNEVIVPMAEKDDWNAVAADQGQAHSRSTSRKPELAGAAAGALPGRLPEPGRAQRDREAAGRPGGDPADRHPDRPDRRVPELHRYACRPTCCGSTWPSRRRRRPTSTACSAATWPASRTDAGWPTTWWRSSCGRSPARPTRWSTPRSRPDGAAAIVDDGVTPDDLIVPFLPTLPLPRRAAQRLLRRDHRDGRARARAPARP